MALGFVDLVVLLEEMGRAVVPGPFFSTVLLGGLALLEAGSDAQKKTWLPKLCSGEARATLAWMEPSAEMGAAGITLQAAAKGPGFTLSGTKLFVHDAHTADVIVVAARTASGQNPEEGISLFLVPTGTPGLTVTLLPTMDQTRKLCEVTLTNVSLAGDAIMGAPGAGWKPLARVIDRATVGLCAEMCGGAQKVLDMTVEYAKIRQAFGRPIGSYQGVKHRAADMLVDVENSKSITYYAAWTLDEGVAEGGHLRADVGEAPALVLVDQEVGRPVHGARVPDGAQRGWCVLEDPQRHAAHVLDDDLERISHRLRHRYLPRLDAP